MTGDLALTSLGLRLLHSFSILQKSTGDSRRETASKRCVRGSGSCGRSPGRYESFEPSLPTGTHERLAITALLVAALFGSVLAAVHHAEVVAHRVGEPYGTLVLALAVTAIEVALIVSLMITGGESASGLARDAVFASVMIILNGMVGLCLLSGGQRHGEQSFGLLASRPRWQRWRRFLC